ncbi:TonB-dependent receptor [Prosthecochloris sp. SCSIO W1101]|uniref:TonB-dependent receptor n=1 Tax=Prosthecochloris sp. SCSIO W1101 TaxID=2992242 RepID=UPI00223DA02B|nr:TonB-dependent receptor [Prosthecochloris sp. SCSIO W1101]UZJ40153.1 TonB-dependent receptor [Prosthecochloris sp. SCSIO W1101]
MTKGSFCVANLSLAKRIPVGNSKTSSVTVKGSVENLFDRNYEYVLGYPMPGRTFTLGLRFDI